LKARDAESKQVTERQRQSEINAAWEKRAIKLMDSDPELQDAIDEIGPVAGAAGVSDLFKQSEVGPEMLLHLHRNPEEAQRIVKLGSAVLIAKELGKLEDRLIAAKAPPKATPVTKPQINLPKPVSTVGGSSSPEVVDLDNASLSDFKAQWRKGLGR
jgi:hypothetical protein